MSFSARLKAERKRLKLTQTQLAGLARTTKQSQLKYEKDLQKPGTEYLQAVAEAGVDVQYLLTGVRSEMALTPDERGLLALYRAASPEVRAVTLAALKAGQPGNTKVVTVGRDNNGTITL